MGKTLVLAEKPSVGKEIARVLGCHGGGSGYMAGAQYVVTWALGHLVELAEPEAEVQVVIPATGRAIPALMEALIPEEAEEALHIMAIEIIKQTVETGGLV